MALINSNIAILDRKVWEFLTPSPVISGAAAYIISSGPSDPNQLQMYVLGSAVMYLYYPKEDAWLLAPAVTLGGTFTAGAHGAWNPNGPTGTASAGSTTTLTTNLTIPGSLVGYKVRITAGTGAGQEAVITSNTVGANSVLTFAALGTALDNTSQYVLRTGRFYLFNAGTMSATSFQAYDVATGVWTAKSITSAPATWATDGRLTATNETIFATGTATAGAASTITNSAKNWAVNEWTNYQIRITSGTGKGQIRTIASNTATIITVSVAWTITPDATSVYSVEANEDNLYLMGNGAVTLYKYSISGNSWSTLAPGAARAAAPGLGASCTFVDSQTDPAWLDENNIINGRRLYSFRAGAGNVLDYYDIPGNTWVSALAYRNQSEVWTTGSDYAYTGGWLYIQKDATGRWFKFSFDRNEIQPFSTLLYAQGAALLGDRGFAVTYQESGVTLRWICQVRNTGTELFRCLVI